MTRTAQSLLAERRALIQEWRRETDEVARETLQAMVGVLDAELGRITGAAPRTGRIVETWGVE